MDGIQKEAGKKHFFINICHRLLPEGQARGCPADAAVCAVGELPGVPRVGVGDPPGSSTSGW